MMRTVVTLATPAAPARIAARAASVALLVAMLALGCSRGTGPTVQFVQGRITLDGQPVEGATVYFTPTAAGLSAYGTTKTGGVFRLTSVRGGALEAGAVVGEYAVSVRKLTPVTEKDIGTLITRAEFERQLRDNANVSDYQPEVSAVPKAYADAARSGLQATVKKGRNTGPDFQFDLRPDFKGK